MTRDECCDGLQHEIGGPAAFMVVVEGDGDTAAIGVPVASVPTNLMVKEESLSTSIISDEPMIWPKNLPAVTFMS